MKTRIERGINDAYLIIEDDNLQGRTDFEDKMLTDHVIDGLLPLRILKEGDRKQYMYSVRGKVSMVSKFENQDIRSVTLAKVIEGINEGLKKCEEYMIQTDHVILRPQLLFIDSDLGTPGICVYPFSDSDLKAELRTLADYLISKTDHNENLAIDLAYGFYRQVMSGDYRFEELVKPPVSKTEQKGETVSTDRSAEKQNKEERIEGKRREKRNAERPGVGSSIVILLVFLIVIFCFALCVLLLYFR